MKVLYKDEMDNLAVMEVSKASWDMSDDTLVLNGPEDDISVEIPEKKAISAIRALYETGKVDLSAYNVTEFEFDDDDDDYEDDDEFEAMLDRILDDPEKNGVLRFK